MSLCREDVEVFLWLLDLVNCLASAAPLLVSLMSVSRHSSIPEHNFLSASTLHEFVGFWFCVCVWHFFPPCYFSCHFITQSFPVALPCSSTHLYGLHLNTVTSVFLRQPPEQQVSSTHNLYSFPHEQLVCPSKGVSKYTQRLYRSSIWTEGTKKYIADKS